MSYVIALLQKKGGATKTIAINLLGALLEKNKKVILCDMDKEKSDSIYWAENGEELNQYVIPLFDENPLKKIEIFRKEYQFIIIDTPPQLEAAAAACALMANKPYKFLASRVIKNTNSTKELLPQLEATETYFRTSITNSVVMTECQSKGAWVGSYAPLSNNHLQYRALVDELFQTLGIL